MADIEKALIGNATSVLGTSGALNTNSLRPFLDDQGQSKIVVNAAGDMINANESALLRYDEWESLDTEVVRVAVQRMVGIRDLQAAGLTHNLGGLGVTLSQWEEESDMTAADVSMSGVTDSDADTPSWNLKGVPVPIVHKDFSINIRRLSASRTLGESLDVTSASIATRRVMERSEDMLFGSRVIKVDGNNLYTYLSIPGRTQVDMPAVWSSYNQSQNASILDDAQTMLQAARDDNHHGPFVLYVPSKYEYKLDEDFNVNYPGVTVRERLEKLSNLNAVRVADRLPDDNVVLVKMARETVDLAIAQPVTPLQWASKGGLIENFKVMACWAPRLKSDYDGRCGIVHLRRP